ncbi:MAG: hypothetical protein ABGF52_05475 [Candidatus Asgardarchaeum sp.]
MSNNPILNFRKTPNEENRSEWYGKLLKRKNEVNYRVWISFLGHTPIATINCIWAAIKRDSFIPDKVILIATPSAEKVFEKYKEVLRCLLEYYNDHLDQNNYLGIIRVSERPTFSELQMRIKGAIDRYITAKDVSIAVDITPGRKIMTVASLSVALLRNVDRIYYLYLIDEKAYGEKLYSEIPCRHQILYQIVGDELAGGKFVIELGCDKDVYSKR